MNTQLRHPTTGRFVRMPVSPERYWNRVAQLATRRSMAEAEQLAADELKLVLILDDSGTVTDWYARGRA